MSRKRRELTEAERWERNARRRNNKRDRKLPLLAWAGVADQVVPTWTAESVAQHITGMLERQAVIRAENDLRWRRRLAGYITRIRLLFPEQDIEALNEQIEAKLERWQKPRGDAFELDWWNKQLATLTGKTNRETFDETERWVEENLVLVDQLIGRSN